MVGVSVDIGNTDDGRISVAEIISERKQNATEDERKDLETIPVTAAKEIIPFGGLVPSGKTPKTKPESEVIPASSAERATSTADEAADNADNTEADGTRGFYGSL